MNELAEVTSSDGGQFVQSKSTHSVERCYCEDKETVCYPCSQYGMMPEHSTESLGVGSWILSLPDSHANHSVQLDKGKGNRLDDYHI
jgi:hypothetical protein